jgi:quercetin dioxygenase-like cupin family protein
VNTTTADIFTATAESIEQQRWQPLPQVGAGVAHKVLWQAGRSIAGIMRIEPHGKVEWHSHRLAHHHIWVLQGTVDVAGRLLGPGSYAHVPASVEHGLAAVGAAPTVFLYTYLDAEG